MIPYYHFSLLLKRLQQNPFHSFIYFTFSYCFLPKSVVGWWSTNENRNDILRPLLKTFIKISKIWPLCNEFKHSTNTFFFTFRPCRMQSKMRKNVKLADRKNICDALTEQKCDALQQNLWRRREAYINSSCLAAPTRIGPRSFTWGRYDRILACWVIPVYKRPWEIEKSRNTSQI